MNSNSTEFKLFIRKEECCGCTACYAICPKEAISMVEDNEGFEYPQIDENKCVRCYQCVKVCPFKVAKEEKEDFPLGYGVKCQKSLDK